MFDFIKRDKTFLSDEELKGLLETKTVIAVLMNILHFKKCKHPEPTSPYKELGMTGEYTKCNFCFGLKDPQGEWFLRTPIVERRKL